VLLGCLFALVLACAVCCQVIGIWFLFHSPVFYRWCAGCISMCWLVVGVVGIVLCSAVAFSCASISTCL
jgi:hypothetical protein